MVAAIAERRMRRIVHSKASDTVLYAISFDNMDGLRILLGSWTLANGALSPTGAAGADTTVRPVAAP